MFRKIYLIFLFLCAAILVDAQINKSLLEVFKKFQEGYTKRDTSSVEKFVDELCTKDIQIIGTGDEEWLQGSTSAKVLFKNDWLYWFALAIDTSSLNIIQSGKAAFFRVKGIASISFPNKEVAYEFAYTRLQQLIALEKTNKSKLLSYSSEASNLIQQIESGSLEIRYSIRISGGLVKYSDKWKFQQIVYSFPYPLMRE